MLLAGRPRVGAFALSTALLVAACQLFLVTDRDGPVAGSPFDGAVTDSAGEGTQADASRIRASDIQRLIDGQRGAAQIAVNVHGLFWVEEDVPRLNRLCPSSEFTCTLGSRASLDLTWTPKHLVALGQYVVAVRDSFSIAYFSIDPLETAKVVPTSSSVASVVDIVAVGDNDVLLYGGPRSASPTSTAIIRRDGLDSADITVVHDMTDGVLRAVAFAEPDVAYITDQGLFVSDARFFLGPIRRWSSDTDGALLAGAGASRFALATEANEVKLVFRNAEDAGSSVTLSHEDRPPTALAANAAWVVWSLGAPNTLNFVGTQAGQTPIHLDIGDAPATSLTIFREHLYRTTADGVFRIPLP